MSKKIGISPSGLGLFKECPRCYWLDRKMKLSRPRGIYPSLPNGMDLVIKTYYDKYRAEGLPPILKGKMSGLKLYAGEKLEKWRSWRSTDLSYEFGNVKLSGAIDDCLTDDGGVLTPLDNKTKGGEFKDDPVKYAEQYYQTQIDCYALLFKQGGYEISKIGYLVYFIPSVEGLITEQGLIRFGITVIKMNTDIERAKELVAKADALLSQDKMPESSVGCEYCNFIADRNEIEKS
jgi:hypothetical protein